ncbi:MAG: hypothetical protein GF408_01835 [Candidatus Omnitrophica bacterium]|nr:hypothetical protein [Candidatus Omnitrophota bacterium]
MPNRNLGPQSIFNPLFYSDIGHKALVKHFYRLSTIKEPSGDHDIFASIRGIPLRLCFSEKLSHLPGKPVKCVLGNDVYLVISVPPRANYPGRDILVLTPAEYCNEAAGMTGGIKTPGDELERLASTVPAAAGTRSLSPADAGAVRLLSFLGSAGFRELSRSIYRLLASGRVFLSERPDGAPAAENTICLRGEAGRTGYLLLEEVLKTSGFGNSALGEAEKAFERFISTGAYDLEREFPALYDLFSSVFGTGGFTFPDNSPRDEHEKGPYGPYFQPPIASDTERAPDHRLLNAVLRTAIKHGLTERERFTPFVRPPGRRDFIEVYSYGPVTSSIPNGPRLWLMNHIIWQAIQEGLLVEKKSDGLFFPEVKGITVWIPSKGTASANFRELYFSLSEKARGEVREAFTGTARKKRAVFLNETGALFKTSLDELEKDSCYQNMDTFTAFTLESSSPRKAMDRQINRILLKRRIAALRLGYPSWESMPANEKRAAIRNGNSYMFRHFGDLYGVFTDEMRREVEELFAKECLGDGVPLRHVSNLFADSVGRLPNISGHAGIRNSRIHVVNGTGDLDGLIAHEMREMLFHQHWIAGVSPYAKWEYIPDEEKDEIVEKARFIKERAPGKRILRKADPAYGEFAVEAHTRAQRFHPVLNRKIRGERLSEGTEKKEDPSDFFHPPAAAGGKKGPYGDSLPARESPDMPFSRVNVERYDLPLSIAPDGANIIDIIVSSIRSTLGEDTQFVLIPHGSLLYLRDEKENILWDLVSDMDFDIVFFEKEELPRGTYRAIWLNINREMQNKGLRQIPEVDISLHRIDTEREDPFDEYAHYYLNLFTEVFATEKALREYDRYLRAPDLLENIEEHYRSLSTLSDGTIRSQKLNTPFLRRIKKLKRLIHLAWMRRDLTALDGFIEELTDLVYERKSGPDEKEFDERLKEAAGLVTPEKGRKMVDRIIKMNKKTVKTALTSLDNRDRKARKGGASVKNTSARRGSGPSATAYGKERAAPHDIWDLLNFSRTTMTVKEIAAALTAGTAEVKAHLNILKSLGLVLSGGKNPGGNGAPAYSPVMIEREDAAEISRSLASIGADEGSKIPSSSMSRILRATEKKWPPILLSWLFSAARTAPAVNGKVLIAVETSWIPSSQKPYAQKLLVELERNLPENCAIIRGSGRSFYGSLSDKISGGSISPENVVILGNVLHKDNGFSENISGRGPEVPFTAWIDGSRLDDNCYVRLFEMMLIAGRYAFTGKWDRRRHPFIGVEMIGRRAIVLTPLPDAAPIDPQHLKEIYKALLKALRSA